MALWQFNEADTTFLLEQLDNFGNVQGIPEGTVRVDEATVWYGTRYVREHGTLDKSCHLLEGCEALDVRHASSDEYRARCAEYTDTNLIKHSIEWDDIDCIFRESALLDPRDREKTLPLLEISIQPK
jgi:hypothetical protein